MDLDRNVGTSTRAGLEVVIQRVKADHSALLVFDEDDIVADLFADRLLARIIKPDCDGIAGSIV